MVGGKALGAQVVGQPPLGVKLKYHLLGFRVPAEWLPWAELKIGSAAWPGTEALRRSWVALIYTAGVLSDHTLYDFVLALLGIFLLAFVNLWRIAGHLDRERAWTIAYQRGERRHPMLSENPGPPFRELVPWMIGGLALAAGIVLLVRTLT
jgi:hypothetical protein